MKEKIDARGLSCPQPVILVKRAIEGLDKGCIEILVDTTTSKENISRLAAKFGLQIDIKEMDGEFILKLENK
jgi:TusA-related sulfurtransferase